MNCFGMMLVAIGILTVVLGILKGEDDNWN